MCPDKVAIYAINPDQEKNQMLSNFFDAIKEQSGEEILEIRNPEDVIPVEELDDEQQVIVFDNIKINKKNMDRINDCFSLSRHKNCCNIYLCQSHYDVPKYIRRNFKCFCSFPSLDNRDKMNTATDHVQGIGKEEFKRI